VVSKYRLELTLFVLEFNGEERAAQLLHRLQTALAIAARQRLIDAHMHCTSIIISIIINANSSYNLQLLHSEGDYTIDAKNINLQIKT